MLLRLDAGAANSDELSRFCSRLAQLGCAYFSVWGPDCERVHDIMDQIVIGENPPATYLGCLMTTWHANEPLVDAVDFFLICTIPDEESALDGCPFGLAIVVGSGDWAIDIEQYLRFKLAA